MKYVSHDVKKYIKDSFLIKCKRAVCGLSTGLGFLKAVNQNVLFGLGPSRALLLRPDYSSSTDTTWYQRRSTFDWQSLLEPWTNCQSSHTAINKAIVLESTNLFKWLIHNYKNIYKENAVILHLNTISVLLKKKKRSVYMKTLSIWPLINRKGTDNFMKFKKRYPRKQENNFDLLTFLLFRIHITLVYSIS